MALGQALLGLLEDGPRHGYELKQRYDDRLGHGRPIPFGQVYATLARLNRDGLIDISGVEAGSGPDRKLYVITRAGVADVERWLGEPQRPAPNTRDELFARVVLALMTGRPADRVLDLQRAEHLKRMRVLTDQRRDQDIVGKLACDHELFHLEADLRWIEQAGERLMQISREVTAPRG